jgi:hypothetical protein
MSPLNSHDLKYGIIYVIGNPKQTNNLKWFATMIEPMIRPLSLEWVETWDVNHTVIAARRFNVGNIGKYATVQLHLNRYGSSDSYSLLAAVHAFSDCLEDVMDDGEGDVIINEKDYRDRNEMPQGKWGGSTASTPFEDVLHDYHWDLEMRQDHTRVAESRRVHYHINRAKLSCEEPDDYEAEVEKKPESRLKKTIKSLRNKRKKDDNIVIDEDSLEMAQSCIIDEDSSVADYLDAGSADSANVELLDLEAEEVAEFRRIESEYERDVKDLRARIVAFIAKYHQDPEQVMATMLHGKVLLGSTTGHLLVNGDMKIVLPEYDELEIEMPAMCRTLYILFMKQRLQGDGGIVLKDIDKHRDELINIYSMVKPGANENRVVRTVDNLCDPFSDSLNQNISRINRCIRNVITDKNLAQQYIITGNRGEQYGIALDPEWMQLPRAVTN